MLVLTRRIQEKLVLQVDDIEIVISLVKIKGNRASLGVVAPQNVKILRQELIDKQVAEPKVESEPKVEIII